jgi:tRNA(His) guanylyltransferase
MDLASRMKTYEGLTCDFRLMPLTPVLARIDGRAFHTFTRDMDRPFDMTFADMMFETMRWLVAETSAVVGYTQSDEISLGWYSADYESKIFFEGRVLKMASILASMASVKFNLLVQERMPQRQDRMPVFDARVWNVPTLDEAANYFIWREQDAARNSVQMAGRAQFSHKALMNKTCDEIQEMLFQQKGINWNDYPAGCKRGRYVRRRKVLRAFTAQEIKKLPAQHEARSNPFLQVVRTDFTCDEIPMLTKVVNRVQVLFEGDEPTFVLAPPEETATEERQTL